MQKMANEDAQYHLGLCYANGEGVTKDDTQAVNWWRKAAEQGLNEAKNMLEQENCKPPEFTKHNLRKNKQQE
jgi:TPR repeat protein